MPLFGKKRELTNADWILKSVKVDPNNRKFLETMLDEDGITETGRQRELMIRSMYLILLKFLEDRLLEYMPDRETRQEFSQLFHQTNITSIPKYIKFMERVLPDYQQVYTTLYIEFAAGGYLDYELRNDGAYKLPGR